MADRSHTPNTKQTKKLPFSSPINDTGSNSFLYTKIQVMSVKIEINEGHEIEIPVFQGDNPYDVAVQFCNQNNIDLQYVDPIANKIKEHMNGISVHNSNFHSHEEDVDEDNKGSVTHVIPTTNSKQHSEYLGKDNLQEFKLWKESMEHNLMSKKRKSGSPYINDNARKLSFSKTSNRPVYERLHDLSVIKHKKQEAAAKFLRQSPAISKPRSKTLTKSEGKLTTAGIRLYEQGLKRMEEKKQFAMIEKEKRIQLETESLTHTPKINTTTRPQRKGPVEENLASYLKMSKEKYEKEKLMKSLKLMKECPFHPEINKSSEQIVLKKEKELANELNMNGVSKCVLLYEDALKRKEGQSIMRNISANNDCTFKPNIKISQEVVPKMVSKQSQNKEMLFPATAEKVQQHPECLFVPQVGRPPKNDRNEKKLPIGEYLYNKSKDIKEVPKESFENVKAAEQQKRDQIVERMKIKLFENLFCQLDSNKDGKISNGNMQIQGININIINIIQPIFNEIRVNNYELEIGQFTEACLRLYNTLTYEQRDNLLKERSSLHKKDNSRNSFTFAPTINLRSAKIAEKFRDSKEPVEETLYKENVIKKYKMEELKKQKNQDELRDCTFYPDTSATSSTYSFINEKYKGFNERVDELMFKDIVLNKYKKKEHDKEQNDKEMKECTFTPTTNHKSSMG